MIHSDDTFVLSDEEINGFSASPEDSAKRYERFNELRFPRARNEEIQENVGYWASFQVNCG